ncbi:DUF4004 family protein [Rossellomorea aquimaris]|uniref:DUF4004 family protein n=1 Tax=Rossellomorea aquimaris TaxID=189382 RepID=UPI0007D0476B|nr:DUF4004 family protein [Rossellomorea aquimaris]
MEGNLISKKEVLELTGISYGQLYRWKRKNIIPEDWFIKKSSFTGQETFFPREKMLSRIDKIKEMKDTYSLDELSDFFSPNPTKIELSIEELRVQNLISEDTLTLCTPLLSNIDSLEFPDILNMTIVEKVSLTKKDQERVFHFLKEHFDPLKNPAYQLIGLRKGLEVIWLLLPPHTPFSTDGGTEIKLDLLQIIEELKTTLSNGERP